MSTEARPDDVVAGRYRLDTLLGRGGMGRVWRGHDEVLGREIAVKELLLPRGVDAEEAHALTRRTVREAQAAARLVHRSIVTVYDVAIHDDRPWIVMQFVSGRPLDEVMRTEGPLPPDRAAGIALQILDALGVAHQAGVVHRDVKPANVIVQPNDSGMGESARLGERVPWQDAAELTDRVVLTDFGIATIEGDPTLTSTGMLLGSPSYLAPERARGDAAVPESDLWSVGATLYAMVEGHPPYQRESSLATLAAVVNEPATPHHQQGLLAAVLDGLLRKDPAERMPRELAAALLGRVASTPARNAARPAAPDAVSTPAASSTPAPASTPSPVGTPAAAPPAVSTSPPASASDPASASGPVSISRSTGEASDGRLRRRWLVPAATVAALAVVLSVALLTGLPDTRDPERDQGSRQAPPSAVRSGSPEPSATSPSASPSRDAGSPQVPDGFRWYRDRTGFALAIPQGWEVSRQDHYVYVRDPDSGRFLLIDQTDQPKDDAVADWKEQEAARRDGMRDYERIRIERVDYFREAADWEFRHTRDGVRLHVVNRGFVTSKSQAYGLYWSTPERRWDDSLRYFQVFTRTFRPAR